MSSIIDNEDSAIDSAIRTDDLKAAAPAPAVETKPTFVIKPKIPSPHTAEPGQKIKFGEHEFTPEQIVAMSKELENKMRSVATEATLDSKATTQVISKSNVKVVDYSKLTMDDVYDLSIPMQAKPFGSADSLKVDLLDKNYEARWVNKTPRRLGQMLSYGFVYVTGADLAQKLEVEVIPDASGHFTLDDVVLMRIPKAKYYSALRAAHERAVNTVSQVGSAKAAKNTAESFMVKEGGGEYAQLSEQRKIDFYKPGIEI